MKLGIGIRNKIKQLKMNKQQGSANIIILGIITISFIVILLIFNFRVNILSETIYTIDDSMTASVLGSALPELDASSKVKYGHLEIQNIKDYEFTSYERFEKSILASEINSIFIDGNSKTYRAEGMTSYTSITTADNFSALEAQGVVKINESRRVENLKITDTDSTIKTFMSNFSKLVNSNITNGGNDNRVVNNFLSVDEVRNLLTVTKSGNLSNTFYNNLITDNIQVSKVELYNLHKRNIAKRHTYTSPYFRYNISGGVGRDGTPINYTNLDYKTYKTYENTNDGEVTIIWDTSVVQPYDNSASWVYGGTLTENERQFSAYINSKYPTVETPTNIPAGIEGMTNESFTQYYILRYFWQLDSIAYNNRNTSPLVCYEDMGVTYESDWNSAANPYKYTYCFFWSGDSRTAIKITSSLLTDDSGRKVAPSEYYSKYTFDANNGTKIEILNGQPVAAKYISNTKSTSITLYSTSVYIEYQYSLSTFPNGGNILRVEDFGVQKVKQSKLVSVTQ